MKSAYTTGEIATMLGVSRKTVMAWVDAGTLKGVRLPGSAHRRIYHDDLVRFMDQHGFARDRLSKS